MFDTHIHTLFSSDSKMTIQEAKQKLISLNMGGIITEHIDFNYPDKKKFRFNPSEYFQTYNKYSGGKLLLGVEIGLDQEHEKENRSLVDSWSFDYVIGSIHAVDGCDLYFEDFYNNKSKQLAYERYLEFMEQMVKTQDFFDCLGHIDYICRYARYYDKEMCYCQLSDYIDQVIKAVIYTGRIMELNTKRLCGKADINELIKIYRRYYDLGGRYVSLGSDAHNPEAIGEGFKQGMYILEKCSLQPVYFKKRKMEYCK